MSRIQNWLKNYGLITLALLAFFIISWQFIARFYDQQVTQQQVTYLEKKGDFLLAVSQDDLTQVERFAKKDLVQQGERITLLNQAGMILYDSYDEHLQNDSRTNRPEIKAVMDGNSLGQAIRKSNTLNETLLYVALPIKKDGNLVGYLRLSEPVTEFVAQAAGIKRSIFIYYLLFYLMGYLLVFRLIRKRNRPVETVLPVLQRMLDDPKTKKTLIYESDSPDMQELYQVITQLNEQMQKTYTAYETSEKRLSTLLNELMIGVFLLDDQQVLTMNVVMQKMLGLQTAPKENQPFTHVLTDTQLIQLIYHVSEDCPFVQQELTLSQTNMVVDVTLRYFKEDHQILATAYDLTKIRQLEKMQRDFVGNVTHELKTPVTSLIGFTETLLDGAKEDPETLEKFLLIMQTDAKRLEALIQQVIQLSKMSTRYDYEWKTIPIHAFIKQIIERYQALSHEKHVQFVLDGSEQLLFLTKLELFDGILKNLIENALFYSPTDTTVHIHFATEQDHLILTIADQGIGIAKEDQERIFERFYRIDKARTRYSGGSGLGLAIVKEYTEALGGSIHVTSQLQKGSRFIVRIPLY